MKVSIKTDISPSTFQTDCVIVPVFQKEALAGAARVLDDETSGSLTALLSVGDFTGKQGQLEVLYPSAGVTAKRIMLVGCGKAGKYDLEVMREVVGTAGKRLKCMKLDKVACWLAEPFDAAAQQQAIQLIITTLADCFYTLDNYKSDNDRDDRPTALSGLVLAGVQVEQGVRQGEGIAQGVTLAKNMANQPGNVCTPAYLAENALELAEKSTQVTVEVLEEKDMEALGMGAFLSVSKGSQQDGKLIVIQYQGGKEGVKPVVLVGKGITFDTGGISLKPGAKMDEMKFDMGGAASVLGTLQAVITMQLPINVVGVIAAAENMPSGHASKPGDIVTAMSGKTIEILNTDAEGRLVLCDALTYVEKFNPDVVIDIATLTGACIVALGHHISGLISNDDRLADDLMKAGNDVLDPAWRLPYNDKYKKQLKSEFADLGNIGGPAAGTITAGCFLSEFTKDYQWAHLDVAGTAWCGKAATGRPVPLLTQYLLNRLDDAAQSSRQ